MRSLARGAVLIAAALGSAAHAAAAEHRVVIEGMAFTPKVASVRVGDTVTWVNRDIVVHNVAAPALGIKSGELQPGQSWRHVVRQGESFDYLCTLHPVMTGRVEVRGAVKPARRRSTS